MPEVAQHRGRKLVHGLGIKRRMPAPSSLARSNTYSQGERREKTGGGIHMATGRRVWATERTWAIKGVSDRTRAAVLEAAHGAGLTVGQWVEQVLARATEEARHPKPSPAGAAVTERINQRLRPVEEELGRIAERLASLEGRIDRGGRPEPAGETAAPLSPRRRRGAGGERARRGRPSRRAEETPGAAAARAA